MTLGPAGARLAVPETLAAGTGGEIGGADVSIGAEIFGEALGSVTDG